MVVVFLDGVWVELTLRRVEPVDQLVNEILLPGISGPFMFLIHFYLRLERFEEKLK